MDKKIGELLGNKILYSQRENKIQELEELIKAVPYNLQVALIKLCQINNYTPMEIEKYYEQIAPTFHLLKRMDGTQYHSNSIKSVRSAMLTNKLFYKNEEGLFALNINNALDLLRQIRKRNLVSNGINNNYNSENKNFTLELNKINKEFNEFNKNLDYNISDFEMNKDKILGKKRKTNIINKNYNKNNIKKYEKIFNLFNNLLKISYCEQKLLSKLNIDFNIFNNFNFNENSPNTNKIIGMLTIFKFFRPLLVKNFNSIKIHEKIIKKIDDLSNEINNIEDLYKIKEE